MSKYELTYFDMRALAEPIRILLCYVGADWQDNRIPKGAMPDEIRSKCTFGQLPLLEVDGLKLNQHLAIMRFIARRHDLAGKDASESAKVDEMVDAVRDMHVAIRDAYLKREEKPEAVQEAAASVKTRFVKVFNKLAEENGGFLVGKSRTWADILLADTLENSERITAVTLTDDAPALKKLMDDVFNSKGVKEYIANRKETTF